MGRAGREMEDGNEDGGKPKFTKQIGGFIFIIRSRPVSGSDERDAHKLSWICFRKTKFVIGGL